MFGKMRRLFNIYILVLLALSVACQRVDLPEVNQPAELPTGAIGSKATITFSTADVTGPETRGIVNNKVEVETLHLIVFDENGMLVEVCKATELGSSDHEDDETGEEHKGGRHYTVELTLTDEPRIIHYVANCPVEKQVMYGHETSVIGNMFVDRNRSEGATTEYEVSYWARIEVPHILVKEKEVEQPDGSIKKVLSLVDDIKDKFMHVPLLRNYAEITITAEKPENNGYKFEVIGFTVYNLLNRGTVAPYNSNEQKFQDFFTYENGVIKNYSYPQISGFGYEGHALTSAELITDFIRYDKDDEIPAGKKVGDVIIYEPGQTFYVYERKVSVMTDEEEKWRESPPHIIIKARYNGGEPVDNNSPIYYYKVDLVYTEKDANGIEEIKYYNILRNFMYDFNITAIHDVGYKTLEEAVAGAAGNNISGSSTTSKLTNVSDNEGRLWVSYTDITLVTNEPVVFRYKYVPNYYGAEEHAYKEGDVHNELVRFDNNIVGDVITGIEVATTDITSGEWKDWREVTIHVNAPSDITRQQILYLKTDNSNLNRQIRHTLRKRLAMQVECTPKVPGAILQPMQVDIKLPLGMTEDMFPLALNMETKDRTLSPDATKNSIPVTAGYSIIEGHRDELSYYYTVTIPTFDDYKALPNDGNMKVYSTYWLTNMANNASTFYVDNKYFEQGSDSWENYTYVFSNVSCSQSDVGVGKDVTIKYTMDDKAVNTPVTISLVGMTYDGASTFTYTTSQKSVSLTCKTTTETDPVSFTLDADDYNIYGPVEGSRQTYKFNGAFDPGVTNLKAEADVEVDFTFTISDEALNALKGLYGDVDVPMYVTLDRMHPADDKLVYSQIRVEGDRYVYRIKQAGTQTIKLATTEDTGGTCAVTLEADYFDTQTVTIQQSDVDAKFNRWEDTLNTSVTSATREFVVIGEEVYYYVNVSAKATPTSVTIDGKPATLTEVVDNTTTWRITWSKNDKNVYPMSATVNIANENYTIDLGNMKVAGLTIGNNSTTSLDKTGNTLYVLKNRSYASTYLTAANENNLAANTSQNYYNLFTVSNNKIVSVARNKQLKSSNSNNSNITFDTTGTDYTFAVQNTSYMRISYTYNSGWNTNYIRESSEGTVQSSTSTNNNRSDWQFYTVTIEMP